MKSLRNLHELNMKNRWLALRAMLPLVVAASPAVSAHLLQSVTRINGSCQKLKVLEMDLSQHCLGNVDGTAYADGRAGFMFAARAPDGGVVPITFTGQGTGQVKQDHDIVVQPVDGLIANVTGRPTLDKAVGLCRFGNPYKPGGFVTCVAETADGRYEADFKHDGSKPLVSKFGQ